MRHFLALLVCAGALAAQTPDLQLRLSVAGEQASFRLGEPIAVEFTFTSTVPDKYTLYGGGTDRMGVEAMIDTFHVSPGEGTVDPLADYFKGGMAGNGMGWMRKLSAEPVVVRKDLNQWVRFDRPGSYRVRATSRRASDGQRAIEVESNEVAIELVDDPAWRTARTADAAHTLRTVPKSGDSKVFQQRMAAARQLWYLNTPESVRESARLYDGMDVQVDELLRLGLFAAAPRSLAIETMEQLLNDPAHPVAPRFLDTLALLQSVKTEDVRARLASSIDRKQGMARAISLRTLFDTAGLPDTIPAAQRAQMAGLFFDLPVDQQSQLLAWEWNRVSGPAMLPVLGKIVEALPDNVYQATELQTSAVERLYEMDPAQGRALILAEMARPSPRLGFHTLSLLPDATLPEMDEKWIANLEMDPGKANQHAIEELIARYATARILPRVQALYARVDSQTRSRPETVGDPPRRIASPVCAPPLYAYFLRADPVNGEKLLRGVMAERSYEMGRCWGAALGETARYYVNPQWESVALDGLKDSTVAVKIDAVRSLGKYGSVASAAGIWEAFRYFHDWWKDKPAAINEENRMLEQAFLQTVTGAANWIATGDDLARAAALCISDGCRGQMEQNRQYWSRPLGVTVGRSSDGTFHVELAQYSMRSLDEARQRLLQLPKGTELSWKQMNYDSRPAPALDAWSAEMQRDLRARGITLAK